MLPSAIPLTGRAVRVDGELWYMFLFHDPSAADLPKDTEDLRPDGAANATLVNWVPDKPWAPFEPRRSSHWAPFGWNWVFGPVPGTVEIESTRSGLQTTFRVNDLCMQFGTAITSLILLARPFFEPLGGYGRNAPAAPREPVTRIALTESSTQRIVGIWRKQCRDNLAFFAWQLRRAPADQLHSAFRHDNEVLVNFLEYFLRATDRRGVAFDPASMTPDDEESWALWTATRTPFAFRWSSAYAQQDSLRFLNPALASSRLTIENAADPGPRVFLVARTANMDRARVSSEAYAAAYETRFQCDDIVSPLDGVNYRVFWLDRPTSDFDEQTPWVDPDPEATENETADEDDDIISLGSDTARDLGVVRINLAVLVNKYGLTARADQVDAANDGDGRNLPQPASPPVSSSAEEDASDTAVDDDRSSDASLGGRLAQWRRDLIDDIELEMERCKLFMTEDGDVDVIPPELTLPMDPSFVDNCEITFPKATELWFIYKLAFHGTVTRANLWNSALRGGLPFRPRFSEYASRRFIDRHRQQIRNDWPAEDCEPAWIAREREPPIPLPTPISNATLELNYRRTIERIKSYPHFETLLFHGGLTWRLVIEFGGIEMGQVIGRRPSVAWILGSLEAPRPLLSDFHSEVFEAADSDALVRAVHGHFSNGTSFWPSQREFLQSYRWRGMWTAGLERWFQAHLQAIRQHAVQPRGDAWWRKHFARPISSIRQAARSVVADRVADTVVEDVRRRTGVAIDTILENSGVVYAADAWIAE